MSNLNVSGGPPIMDVNELIDGQKIRASAVVFLVIATLAMIADGFDIASMGFVVPELVKQWHVPPSALVPALSAGVFGLLLGAPLFGYVGDRFGRKIAIVITLGTVGVLTLASMAVTSLSQLVVLRFLTGLGLGGLFPNIVAIAAEVAPKRRRGIFIIVVNFGVPVGFSMPGWVAAGFVHTHGWPVLFLVGGSMALLVCLAVVLFLQESIRYLMQRGDKEGEVRRLLTALRPDLPIDARTRFVVPLQPALTHSHSPAKLFAGGLAVVTPVLWIVLAANQFANFFTLSWLPTLLQANGATTAQAGINASMFSIGGIAGGIALMFVIDKFGALPVVLLFLVGSPIIAAIGFSHVSLVVLGATIACAGFCVTGNNFGMGAVLGMIYPTPIRSKGTGWAQALGRVGALGAQFAGGAFLANHVSLNEVFLAPALSLLIGAVASGYLVILFFRRFGGFRLDEAAAAPVALVAADGELLVQPVKVPA